MTENKTFNTSTPDVIDTEYEFCNFEQPQPFDSGGSKVGVRLFPGDNTPRHFKNCCLINCELPPGSTIEQCSMAVVERGVVASSEDIVIDNETITLNKYVSRTYGKYDPVTETYIYFSPYRDVPEEN